MLPVEETTVVIGPPADTGRDKEISRRLFRTFGKKVICGGTTSKIVAREMRRELKVKLNTVNPLSIVPPCGEIEGVDLVTEGVLTLSRVLEILRKNIKVHGEDGANELVRILIGSDIIHFIVGKAVNPAYLTLGYIDSDYKLRLVKRLSEVLEVMGKQVSVEYY